MNASAAGTLWIEGVGLWTPDWPDWPRAASALRGEAPAAPEPATPARRPAATMLAANERRRAPDSVLMALEVAAAAVAESGRDASQLASVFTSAHGDLPILDAMCRTLVQDPLALSPTRFHHSVHNAPSGYWAIGSGSQAASTALAGYSHSFACGLLEAAVHCVCEGEPVLLVGSDTEATGALASTNTSRGLLALALVLAPQASPRSRWCLSWQLRAATPAESAPTALQPAVAGAPVANAMADALPLAQALALTAGTQGAGPGGTDRRLTLALGGPSRPLGLALALNAVGTRPPDDAA